MRKFNILVSFAAAALLFVGCGGPQKMADNANLVNYTVTPDPLETHGGKVALDVNVRYPEKYFHKKAIVTATPFLRYEGGETELKSETMQGEQVEDNYRVISYTSGGSFDYSDEIDYTDAMMRSELMVRGTATVKSKSVDLPAVKIADGIITTPLLVRNDPKTIAFGDDFQRIIPQEYIADIHYIINRYDVRNSELQQEDIVGMKDFIVQANANERVDMKGIQVSAYASPDGPEDFNTTLSGNREGSANRYLQQELSRSKINVPEDEDFFDLMSTPEDWEGFRELMEASTITDKDLILRVLSMYTDPVVREREIKNIAEAFEEIKVEILPKLRRSKFTVNTEFTNWSDAELRQWVKTDIDTLGLEELLYAATLFDDNQSKLTILQHTWAEFPECPRAANNLGLVQLAMGRTADAKASFEAAQKLMDHNIVKNNLGVVAMKEGDVETAENLFTSAMGAGDEVKYNLGIIKIMQGDYQAAKSYFGAAASFNNALVILLNDNPSQAAEMLNQLDDDPTGATEYLMAVAGARDNNTDLMYNSLRTAIAKNASWKAHAAKDVEFYQYFEEDLFRQVTQ